MEQIVERNGTNGTFSPISKTNFNILFDMKPDHLISAIGMLFFTCIKEASDQHTLC